MVDVKELLGYQKHLDELTTDSSRNLGELQPAQQQQSQRTYSKKTDRRRGRGERTDGRALKAHRCKQTEMHTS